MSNTKKLLIYPFNAEVMPLLRSKKFSEKYESIILCALKGSGFNYKDAGQADCGELIGITVSENYEECIDRCSDVLFVESQYINIKEDEMQQKADMAIEKGKHVINVDKSESDSQNILNIFNDINITISKDVSYKISYGDLLKNEGLVDITVPIIGVAGTGENTNKFEIELSVVEELERIGYKVSWIGSNKMCKLVGGHFFPQFMFGNETTDSEKVLLFNRYIKNIETTEGSDVILIGVPGGIMPCSKNIVGDFGILSYKVFQGVSPDYLLLSIFYDEYKKNFFEEIKKHVKYKFNCDLDMINICNRRIDWEEVRVLNQNVIPYYTIQSQNIDNLIKDMEEDTDVKLVNIMKKNEVKLIVDNIINKLIDDEPNLVF